MSKSCSELVNFYVNARIGSPIIICNMFLRMLMSYAMEQAGLREPCFGN